MPFIYGRQLQDVRTFSSFVTQNWTRQPDQGHPVAYLDGDLDKAVAWLVEEAGEGRVEDSDNLAEPIRVLCILWCVDPQLKEESQTQRACE
jgi:hypothetical protein